MKPIAEGLFTQETPARLIGGRRRGGSQIVFPCPRDDAFEPYPLGRQGRIWSFTVQRFRPKSPPYAGPEAFEPFAVAYVEIADEVIVEGRVVNVAFEDIEIGMPVELVQVPLDAGNPDKSVLIHAFQPVREGAP